MKSFSKFENAYILVFGFSKEGVGIMCKVVEELVKEYKIEMVESMLELGAIEELAIWVSSCFEVEKIFTICGI